MLIARPDYTPGWTWTRDWEQVCFLKEKRSYWAGRTHRCLPNTHSQKHTTMWYHGTKTSPMIRFPLSCPRQEDGFCSSSENYVWLGFKFNIALFPSSYFFLPQPTNTDPDSILLKQEANRRETQGILWDMISFNLPGLEELPVPKILFLGEKELGTKMIILRYLGKLMEKEPFTSNILYHSLM